MTDHARDDRAREIDTAALRALAESLRNTAEIRERHGLDADGRDPITRDARQASETIPALIDEIDRLRAEVKAARAAGYAAGIADAEKVALDYTAREDDYPSAVARDFYESAVVDAVSDIAESIRALSTSKGE